MTFYVQCPAKTGRRTSVVKGKVRIKDDDQSVDIGACLERPYKECEMCPNKSFTATFETMGPTSDYEWLDVLFNKVCLAMDVKVTKKTRSVEHCCVQHGDVVMVNYDFAVATPGHIGPAREDMKNIYDLIMKEGKGRPREVVHVWARRHDDRGQTFDFKIGFKK